MFKRIRLDKRQKNLLIAGAILLLLGGVYRFYPVIHGVFSVADEMDIKKKSMEKYFQMAARQKGLDKEHERLARALKQGEANLLNGKTPSLAAVEAQGIINEIAQADSVKIQTMQVLKSKESEDLGYISIPIRFSINSNILQLKDIIYRIESSGKLMVITELNVDVSSRGENSELRTTMTVEGVMKGSLKETQPSKDTKPSKKT